MKRSEGLGDRFQRVQISSPDGLEEIARSAREHPANLDRFASVVNESPMLNGTLQPPNRPLFERAPEFHGMGGEIYFSGLRYPDAFAHVLRFMGMTLCVECREAFYRYAVFHREAKNPAREGFLAELRLVTVSALRSYYQINPDESWMRLDQTLSIEDVIRAFTEHEHERWRVDETGFSPLLGMLGGDGAWSHEELGFAIGVENPAGIVRVRSWVWLAPGPANV